MRPTEERQADGRLCRIRERVAPGRTIRPRESVSPRPARHGLTCDEAEEPPLLRDGASGPRLEAETPVARIDAPAHGREAERREHRCDRDQEHQPDHRAPTLLL